MKSRGNILLSGRTLDPLGKVIAVEPLLLEDANSRGE
jgi:hypothetical protein